MKKFESPLDYIKFSFMIKKKSRDPEGSWCQNFLKGLLATCKLRIIELPEKTKLWRSQLGRDKTIIKFAGGSVFDTSLRPFTQLRMKPIQRKGKGGRANPKGVPALYLSTDRETAMAECRPWMGEYISIGVFYTIKNLSILDLSKEEYIPVGINDIQRKKEDQEFSEKVIWGNISKAFTRPIQGSDQSVDYRPTQEIASFFKNHGFDGLKYKSALGVGYNIVMFDLSSAEQADCSLFNVQNIRYFFIPVEGAKYKTPFGEDIADFGDT